MIHHTYAVKCTGTAVRVLTEQGGVTYHQAYNNRRQTRAKFRASLFGPFVFVYITTLILYLRSGSVSICYFKSTAREKRSPPTGPLLCTSMYECTAGSNNVECCFTHRSGIPGMRLGGTARYSKVESYS